jgi:hypothetical protein
MSSRSLFASILMVCMLAVSIAWLSPTASAASAGQPFLKSGGAAGSNVIGIGYYGAGPRYYAPIAPSYRAYDYPYYYRRGYYPRHIGPGYIYYGYPYRSYSRSYSPSYGGRCSYWSRRCVANWGYGNEDYYGCMDFHRCQ